MPLYEYRKNAINHLSMAPSVREEVVCGMPNVPQRILALLQENKKMGRQATAAIDGWYGVDWVQLNAALREIAKAQGVPLQIVSTADMFLSPDKIEDYRRPYLTDDPSFGRVNVSGVLEDILDSGKMDRFKSLLNDQASDRNGLLIVMGPGAANSELAELYGLRFYADFTMQPLLWQMWENKLIPFGSDQPAADYLWKKYYYCDFYLLLRQKKEAFARMDYYIDAVEPTNLKLIPAAGYNVLIDELVSGPIKQVKITQPGP